MLFQGTSSLNLDAKGRLTIPARHRDELVRHAQTGLTITRSPEGCLLVFPRTAWEVKRAELLKLPMSMQKWKRMLVGNATDVEMDASARVLVSPELRAAAGLEKEIVLVGMGAHLELWNKATHQKNEEEAMSAEIPDEVLNQLVL